MYLHLKKPYPPGEIYIALSQIVSIEDPTKVAAIALTNGSLYTTYDPEDLATIKAHLDNWDERNFHDDAQPEGRDA